MRASPPPGLIRLLPAERDLKGSGIMQKIPLGTSGMYVSKVCLGTMTFGDQNNESEAFRLLDHAFDRGINFIDTAEIYPVKPQAATRGLSETIIGNWLKKEDSATRSYWPPKWPDLPA